MECESEVDQIIARGTEMVSDWSEEGDVDASLDTGSCEVMAE